MSKLTSKYAKCLNALDEMQQSPMYAVRRADLWEAECIIVTLEAENAAHLLEIDTLKATITRQGEAIEQLQHSLDNQKTLAREYKAARQSLEAIKTPDTSFTYCAFCGEKSQVDDHNEDLAAHIKVCPKHPLRDLEQTITRREEEIERLKSAVTVCEMAARR